MKTVSLFRKLETEKEDDVPKIDGLRASASQCFSTLAAHAGLDGGVYSCGTEWIKNEENRLHIVQRYDGDEVTFVILNMHFYLQIQPNFRKYWRPINKHTTPWQIAMMLLSQKC